jgi:hypothetical protein
VAVLERKKRPENDFIDMKDWGAGVKAILLGGFIGTCKQDGKQTAR